MSVDFQCEACERVFVNETDLNDHVKLHVACAHCNYSALQQLVSAFVVQFPFMCKWLVECTNYYYDYYYYRRTGGPAHKAGA